MSAAVEAAAVAAGGGVPGATAAATGSVSLESETLGVLDFETAGLSVVEGGLSKAKACSKAFMKQKAAIINRNLVEKGLVLKVCFSPSNRSGYVKEGSRKIYSAPILNRRNYKHLR